MPPASANLLSRPGGEQGHPHPVSAREVPHPGARSKRHQSAIRNAVADAAAFQALRCAECGGSDLFAIEPGSEPEACADLFIVTRPAPARAWCAAHWPASFSVARAA